MKTVRKRYGKLTPFERAALNVGNAFGRRSRAVADALNPPTFYESYWMSHWGNAIMLVAGFAAFRAALDFFCGCAQAPEDGLRGVYAWRYALERLEKETGAPFTKCGGLYGVDVFAVCREAVKERGEEAVVARDAVDSSGCYAALRELWDVHATKVNEEDAWRKLPPADVPERDRQTRSIGKAVEQCAEGAETSPPLAPIFGDIHVYKVKPEDVQL